MIRKLLGTIKALLNGAEISLDDHLVANVQLADPGVDGKVMIAPVGEYPHRNGMQVLDRAALNRVLNQLNALGRDVVIDWGHESFSNPKAEAAGWIKRGTYELRNDGLYAQVEWTAEAKAGIEAKKFRFLSPVFAPDPAKTANRRLHIMGLINAGVTNNPNIPAMKPLTNQLSKETEEMKGLLDKLANALGLKDASEEAVINAVSALVRTTEGMEALKNRLDAYEKAFPAMQGLEGGALANALLMAARPPAASDTEVAELKNRLAALEGKDLETVVTNAIAAGRLTPAQKDWAMKVGQQSRALLNDYLSNVQPFNGDKTMAAGRQPAAGNLTPEAVAVFNMLNIDPSTLNKNEKKEGK